MVRECVGLFFAALLPGCSLILDFDETPAADAGIDAVYTQAECEYKEPNDSLTEAMTITAADTGPAAICAAAEGDAEDRDYYRFTASSATVRITVLFTNRPGGDLDIKLYDAATNQMVAQSRGFGNGEQIVCPGASPSCPTLAAGDYLLEVFPAVPGAVNSYTIMLAP